MTTFIIVTLDLFRGGAFDWQARRWEEALPRNKSGVTIEGRWRRFLAMRTFEPCVYILANRYRGSLYTGVTSDLPGRVYQHRNGVVASYTQDRDIKRLVWFERHDDIEAAIRREKTIKRWPRQWKFNVIEADNPEWDDLAESLGFPPLN